MRMKWCRVMRWSVRLPDLGATPVTLTVWLADPGEAVREGEGLVEVLIPGATVEIPAPVTGRLFAVHAQPRDELRPDQLLAEIDPDEPV
jgi:pyruvate/2-oxoglutarate dehydrogenase complex dihydrolipoamide acyltransferase (E2) component